MIQRLVKWLNAKKTYNTIYRELHCMTNHELRDIGIDRTMITRVALEAAYGDKL
jgi:uncharacterized protein YjiS (DUF1127 family)